MKSCSMIKLVFALVAGFLLSFSPFLRPPPVQAAILKVPGPGAAEGRLGAGASLQKHTCAISKLTCSSLIGTQTPRPPLALDGMATSLENTRSHHYKNIEEYAVVFKKQRLNDLARVFLEFLFSQDGRAVIQQYGVMPVERI